LTNPIPGISTGIEGTTNSKRKNNVTGLDSWGLEKNIRDPAIRRYIQIFGDRNAVSVIVNQRLRLLAKSTLRIISDAGFLAKAKTIVERNRITIKARICSGI